MRISSARHRARPGAKQLVAWVSALVLLAGFISIQPSTSDQANAATVSDVTNSCQFAVSSPAVTIDSTSTSVSLVGARCVIKFLTVGSYSITVPSDKTSLDYLVVAGGGGGGSGGGGGGGVLMGSNLAVTPGASLSLSVGAGGAGGSGGNSSTPVNSTNGGASTFSSLTALGGGSGGQGNQAARNGGSGGGSRYDCTSANSTCIGYGTAGQGNNGAPSTATSYGGGAGGGGAGGAGQNTTAANTGGRGGDGLQSSITGSAIYYGGGGGGGINQNSSTFTPNGGGLGGLGGGGTGSTYGFQGYQTSANLQGVYSNSTAGQANTGGGGGGTDPEDAYASAGGSGIVVLSFLSPASQKTLTLDANDGTASTFSQQLETGVPSAISQNRFSRSGYVFQGWNTAANGTGTAYANMAAITISTPTTLYAQWLVGVNHTITFDANQGTGSLSPQIAGLPTILFANTFTRTGYTFVGWNSMANGAGYFYADLAMHSFYQDQTLYAQWTTTITPRNVVFYGNGATGGTTLTQTANSTNPLNQNGFVRAGYSFQGWNTASNGTGTTYLDLQKYSFAADLSLFAIWIGQGNRVVTFNGNPATTVAMANQTSNIKTALSNNTYVRDGYSFLGWNTLANGTGVNYPNAFSYSFGSAATLYATWGQNITVTYDVNQGDLGSAPPAQSAIVGGPKLSIQGNPLALARTGYILAGWNTAANGSGSPISLWQTNVSFSSNTTLYAQWVPAVFAVTYQGNQSTSGSTAANQTYAFGAQGITLATNSGSLVRVGYEFSGWNTAPDGTGTSYSAGATAVTFTNDTVLFAAWSKLPPPTPRSVSSQSSFTADPSVATQITIKGYLLGTNSEVTVGGVKAKIVSATDDVIVVLLPVALSGQQPLILKSPDGTFTYNSYVNYKKLPTKVTTPAGTDESVEITISGFQPGSAVLTPAIRNQLAAIAAKYSDYKTVSCTGFTEGPTVLSVDRRLSRDRAVNACNFAVSQSRGTFALSAIGSVQEIRKADSARRVTILLKR
jgi:uncharacterized repeat protein (TIGR02543 family)